MTHSYRSVGAGQAGADQSSTIAPAPGEIGANPALLPLTGMRVLEFSSSIMASFCGMMLGELGADVIKIEDTIGGDPARARPSSARGVDSADFLWANRNKRSVAIDPAHRVSSKLLARLFEHADIVIDDIQSASGDLREQINRCCEQNSRIVHCALAPFQRNGSFAARTDTDPVLQAESGFMSMVGDPARPGLRTASPIIEITTAMTACSGVLAAIFSRLSSKTGQRIDVSSYMMSITMLGVASFQQLFTGNVPHRHGNVSLSTSPSGTFRAKDATFHISCSTTAIFKRLFDQVVGRPDIANDDELSDRMGRIKRRDELFGILQEAFRSFAWKDLGPKLQAAGIAVGQVRSLADALNSSETDERRLVVRMPHSGGAPVPGIALPFSAGCAGTPRRGAPLYGEHTKDVLKELLGCSPQQIEELSAANCIRV